MAAKTGWELAVADPLRVLEPPTAAELTALRQLQNPSQVQNQADKPS